MSLLPRNTPDRLQRLREQAFSRLLVEEVRMTPPAMVTRRRAMALVAGAAVVGFRGKAFAVPGPRSAAPQYGAPGISGTAAAYKPSRTVGRAELGSLPAWDNSVSEIVITPDAKFNPMALHIGNKRKTPTVNYKFPSKEEMSLVTIADAHSGYTFVLQAEDAFYVSVGDEMFGCSFGRDDLVVTPSVFKMKTPTKGYAEVVMRFAASMDDAALRIASNSTREIHIALTDEVPGRTWGGANTTPTGDVYYPLITSAAVDKGVLTLNTYVGIFVFDLVAHKMVSFK